MKFLETQARIATRRVLWRINHLFPAWVWLVLSILGALLTALVARADYVESVWNGTISNAKPESQRKRVSMFEAVETEGEPTPAYYASPAIVATNSSTGWPTITHHQYRMRHQVSGVWSTVWTGPELTGGGTYAINVSEITATGSGTYVLEKNEKLGSSWLGWQSTASASQVVVSSGGPKSGSLVLVPEVPGPVTVARGSLLHQWEFELPPHSSTNLSLQHSSPFFVVVEDYKVFMTPDGGEAYGYEEIDEHTSTQNEVESPETEPPPSENVVNAPEVEYTTGEEAAPAARVETVEDLQDLDANNEARHTDEAGILRQIRKGIEDIVGSIAGLAGGGEGEVTSEHEHEEEIESRMEETEELWEDFWEEVDGLYDDVTDTIDMIQPTIPPGTPQLYIEMEIPWSKTNPKKKLILQSNPQMDFWVAIARGICMVGLLVIAADGILTVCRKMFI
jgi:hypothetical protein